MPDYKIDQPNIVLHDAARLFESFAALMQNLVFDEARALAEVNAGYSTTTELADTLQRVSDVPLPGRSSFCVRTRQLRPRS